MEKKSEMSAELATIKRPQVLIVEDLPEMAELMEFHLLECGFDVFLVDRGESALEKLDEGFSGVVILDLRLPDFEGLELFNLIRERDSDNPIVIASAHATFDLVANAIQRGAFDFIAKSDDFVDRLVTSTQNAWEVLSARLQHVGKNDVSSENVRFTNIVGQSPAMQAVYGKMERVVDLSVTLLISGETGTGKEVVARAIHEKGPRASGPFVVLNCGAIPENLLESELFGHERGSFTGAVARQKGKFELAHQGTIFLDEIGEMDLNLQSKLLRVLQEKSFERVGGGTSIDVDVRILSATNRNLIQEVEAGRFRRDLYYRLAVFPIEIPPLRNRPEDIPALVEHFMDRFSNEHGKEIPEVSNQVLDFLLSYGFPGNVRELENIISHACVVASGAELQMGDLPDFLHDAPRQVPKGPSSGDVKWMGEQIQSREEIPSIADVELVMIHRAIELCGGNKSLAAKHLGISRHTLYRRLEEWGAENVD